MIRNFCTYFDSYYIDKGIALYLSLERVYQDKFHLYVMAFDEDCLRKLNEIGFPQMTVELLADFETPELLKVKPTRHKVEYCWTCGPSITYHFLTSYNLPDITYLDSDLYFVINPEILYEEIGDNSVAITEHTVGDSTASGKYCVQFMFFRNDKNGRACLKWWADSCIEWCFARFEDGKYADQKYLESFQSLFKGVVVLQNIGAGIAPWNCKRYKYNNDKVIDNGVETQIVFLHEHALEFQPIKSVLHVEYRYKITEIEKDVLFKPYIPLMLRVYNEYLGHDLDTFQYDQPSKIILLYKNIRSRLSTNPLVRFVFYKVFRVKNNIHSVKFTKKV